MLVGYLNLEVNIIKINFTSCKAYVFYDEKQTGKKADALTVARRSANAHSGLTTGQ